MWTGGLPTKAGYLTYLGSPPPCKQAPTHEPCPGITIVSLYCFGSGRRKFSNYSQSEQRSGDITEIANHSYPRLNYSQQPKCDRSHYLDVCAAVGTTLTSLKSIFFKWTLRYCKLQAIICPKKVHQKFYLLNKWLAILFIK